MRALSSGEAELYGIVDGAARGLQTKHAMAECDQQWLISVESDASAGIGMATRAGVGKVRHIETKWLWVQDATREKKIALNKCRDAENVADLGTKAVEPKVMNTLRAMLPLRPPWGAGWLGAVAAAKLAAQAEAARADDDNEDDADEDFSGMLSSWAIMIWIVTLAWWWWQSRARPKTLDEKRLDEKKDAGQV